VTTPTRLDREGDSQPMPLANDSTDIQTLVIQDIEKRRELGISRYGVALQANNGRDALLDAYEEAMDLTIYLKQALTERDAESVSITPLVDEMTGKVSIHKVLKAAKVASGFSDANRLWMSDAVKLDNIIVDDVMLTPEQLVGKMLTVGKHKAVRLVK
jgi:hypothetical protein